MITLFELQTQSGQLWLEISAHFAANEAAHATHIATLTKTHADALFAVTAERDAAVAALESAQADAQNLATAAKAALKDGKPEVLAALAQHVQKPERERQKAEVKAELARLKAIEAELDKP